MKKIGIITMHRVRNYGSVLQTYALQKALEKLNCDARVIDYIPDRCRLKTDFRVNPDKYTKNGKVNYPKKILMSLFCSFPKLYFTSKFTLFLKKNVKMTQRTYYSSEELKEDVNQYDIVMNGSDQVWNTYWDNGIDDVFFLGFADQNVNKCAYGASFSKSYLSENEIELMYPYLKEYHFISVREKSGIEILNRMGIDGAKWVVDPVLLLQKSDWEMMLSKKRRKKKYIFIYQLNQDLDMSEFADVISNKFGYDIVYFGIKSLFVKKPRWSCSIPFGSPIDFITLLHDADFVLTDSFHGTVFSTLFNKQFLSIKALFPERVNSFLSSIGLISRFVDLDSDINSLINEEIDYTMPNAQIANLRNSSWNVLEELINS